MMNCSTCNAEIRERMNFGARFTDGKWAVFCEKDAVAEGLPLKGMSSARAWVMNGGAEAHREEQKLAEAKP